MLEHSITHSAAQGIGIEKAFEKLKKAFEGLEEAMKHRQVMAQTAEIEICTRLLRKSLGVFARRIELTLHGAEEKLAAAKAVSRAAAPFLKASYYTTQSSIAADANELAEELKKPELLPATTQLGLLDQLNDIDALQQKINQLIDARGEEAEYRKVTGSATAARKKVERQLRRIIYLHLPARYELAAEEAVRNSIEAISIHINGQLDAFRHLLRIENRGGEATEIIEIIKE